MSNKKILSLFLVVAIATVGCQSDFDESVSSVDEYPTHYKLINSSVGAESGVLAIKFSDEYVGMIEEQRTRAAVTRSGVEQIDISLNDISALSFSRIFCDDKYENNIRRFGLHKWYFVSFDEQYSLEQAARSLTLLEGVEKVEFLHTPKRPELSVKRATPTSSMTRNASLPYNDPGLSKQWHYHNEGTMQGSVAGADINLYDAWRVCKGDERIIVAVVDDPINYNHPDLAVNMWRNPDPEESKYLHGANFCSTTDTPLALTYNYVSPSTGEVSSHGVHVAGIVAAVNGNNEGVCGIAGGGDGKRGVSLMSCQIFYVRESALAYSRALVWAANRGAHIAQCSLAYPPELSGDMWESEYGFDIEAMNYFMSLERANSPIDGGLMVFAAGNEGNCFYRGRQIKDQKFYPGAYPGVVAVSSIAPNFTPAEYTSYGKWVEISAPGGEMSDYDESGVYSTIMDGYGYMHGTSMACPHVTGAAALALSHAMNLGKKFTTEEFFNMLISSTTNIEEYFSGAKESIGYNFSNGSSVEVVLNMADYRGKMGSGLLDTYRLLMNVEGTPLFVVGCDGSYEIPLSEIFGGYPNVKSAVVEILDCEDASSRLGFEGEIEGAVLSVRCSERGSAKITLKANTGENDVEREVAIVAREYATQNGGWL